jgi:hypothetical protein
MVFFFNFFLFSAGKAAGARVQARPVSGAPGLPSLRFFLFFFNFFNLFLLHINFFFSLSAAWSTRKFYWLGAPFWYLKKG